MTRRGSLAYYAVAVVCGSFFVAVAYYVHSVAQWGAGQRWAYDFLLVYFLAVIGGFLPQLLNAFVLRRVTCALRWRATGQWMVCGAVVGVALLWGLAHLGSWIESLYFPAEWQPVKSVLVYPLVGPIMLTATPLWLPLPVFAATAWLLCRIHRAFEPVGQEQRV